MTKKKNGLGRNGQGKLNASLQIPEVIAPVFIPRTIKNALLDQGSFVKWSFKDEPSKSPQTSRKRSSVMINKHFGVFFSYERIIFIV